MNVLGESKGTGFEIKFVDKTIAEVSGAPVTVPFLHPVTREQFIEVLGAKSLTDAGYMRTWDKITERQVSFDILEMKKGGHGCTILYFGDYLRIDVTADAYPMVGPFLQVLDELFSAHVLEVRKGA